jgi:uncharacterized protein
MSERFSPCLELKFAGDALASGEFRGYASTFGGSPDSYGDTIAPGAFADTLAKHAAASSAPAMFWAHDPSEPIGRWKSMREDQRGLAVEGKLTLEVQRARDAHALMKDGALGLSIGYRTLKSEFRNSTRVITQLNLLEASLVAVPANPAARVLQVKSNFAERPQSVAEMREALIDIGFGVREAKRGAGAAWRAIERIDEDESQEIVAAVNAVRQLFK